MRVSDTHVTSVIMLPQEQETLKGTNSQSARVSDTHVTSVIMLQTLSWGTNSQSMRVLVTSVNMLPQEHAFLSSTMNASMTLSDTNMTSVTMLQRVQFILNYTKRQIINRANYSWGQCDLGWLEQVIIKTTKTCVLFQPLKSLILIRNKWSKHIVSLLPSYILYRQMISDIHIVILTILLLGVQSRKPRIDS